MDLARRLGEAGARLALLDAITTGKQESTGRRKRPSRNARGQATTPLVPRTTRLLMAGSGTHHSSMKSKRTTFSVISGAISLLSGTIKWVFDAV